MSRAPPPPKPAKAPKAAKKRAPPPPPPSEGNPLLVLVDMNGTLVHRAKDAIAGAGKAHVVANGTHYYAREHARDLVDFLLDARTATPERRRAVLAFYTSMREVNAQPIAKYLCGGRAVDVYERSFNKADPTGENAWDTMRDLPSVWADPTKAAYGFDASNTVVVDDTTRKMREYPGNVLVVPTYDETSVARGGDDALDYLRAYVDALLDEPGDVRTAVDDRPFHLHI